MTKSTETRTEPQAAGGALFAAGKKAGASVVDVQVASTEAFAGYQEKLADKSPVRWLGGGMRAQATLTRIATRRYASTTRGLLG